jgi:tetratricopeptide (TPR) repeat protein
MEAGAAAPIRRCPIGGKVQRKGMPRELLYPNRLDNPRLDTLRRLLADNPANTFARYGLAMEHVRSGDLDGAVQEFEAVIITDPKYSAAYYHGGQALEKLGELDRARDLYRRGIAATRDPHALGELQAALDILGD